MTTFQQHTQTITVYIKTTQKLLWLLLFIAYPRLGTTKNHFTEENKAQEIKLLDKQTRELLYGFNDKVDSSLLLSKKGIQLAYKHSDIIYLSNFYHLTSYGFKKKNRLDSALIYAEKGYLLAQQNRLISQEANLGYLIATIKSDQGNLRECIDQIFINIQFAKKNNIDKQLGNNYILLSYLNSNSSNEPIAEYYFQKAQFYYKTTYKNLEYKLEKEIRENLKKNNRTTADKAYDQLVQEFKKNHKIPSTDYVFRLMSAGEAYLSSGHPKKALAIFNELYGYDINNSFYPYCSILSYLTASYISLNNFKSAEKWHNEAKLCEHPAEGYNNRSLLLKNEISILEEKGKTKEALQALRIYSSYTDSLDSKRVELSNLMVINLQDMDKLELEFRETKEKKEIQQVLLQKEKKQKFFFLFMTLAFITITFSFIILSRRMSKSRSEILRQNTSIEIQAKKLNESNQIKDKLFSIIGHELRSPVSELITVLDARKKSQDFLKTESYLDNINLKAKEVYNILDNLLTWASSQLQMKNVTLTHLSLNELVIECVESIRLELLKKDITLINQVKEELVLANETYTKIVIRNILSNAIKFTPENGFIRIYNSHIDEHIGIAIQDSGSGFNKDLIDSILTKIQPKSTGTNGEAGAGIGLYLCNDLMLKQNGKIVIKNNSKSGSTVEILFAANAALM